MNFVEKILLFNTMKQLPTAFYTLAGAYIGAGEAVFTTGLENINGKIAHHITGDGKTYSFYDNFFKVRDKYETFMTRPPCSH